MRIVRMLVTCLGIACAARAHAQQLLIGSAPPPPPGLSCLPAEQAEAIRANAPSFVGRATRPLGAQATLYSDPMAGGSNSFGRTVIYYVDLDPSAGLLDWNCGQVTYDGHTGEDIEIRDFYDMDVGVPILCAAPGTVVSTHDGEFDRRTVWDNTAVANYVVVQHADGTYAYYWHMRKGSVRVSPSQAVLRGDTLGLVGSSGFSSGPHIHFQTYDAGVREPFTGPCQPQPTLWLSQPPYVLTLPFELFNHGITTVPMDWATVNERPPSKTHIRRGTATYTWIRARNVHASDMIAFQYYSPFGLFATDTYSAGQDRASFYIAALRVLSNSPANYGTWHVDVRLNGTLICSDSFTYNNNLNQMPTIASRTVDLIHDTSVDVDLAGQDPDGSVFWHDLVSGPFHGTAVAGSTRRHLLHYVPAPGYIGPDSVTVHAEDDELLTGPDAVIRFNVTQDATAALLSLESADAEPGAVTLAWYSPVTGLQATLYRSEGDGLWSALATLAPDGTGRLRYVDETVTAGQRYGYRLGVRTSGGERFLGEAWVTTPSLAELSLEGLRPNPSVDDLVVAFSLPSSRDATLALMDVSGRRVLERPLVGLAAGRHVVNLGAGSRVAPGLYLVRLTQGERTVTRKAVVAH